MEVTGLGGEKPSPPRPTAGQSGRAAAARAAGLRAGAREAQILPEPWDARGGPAHGAGMCLAREVGTAFSSQRGVGSLGVRVLGALAPLPVRVRQGGWRARRSGLGPGGAARCPPPPRRAVRSHRASGVRAAARPPAPPPPRRPPLPPRRLHAQIPRAAAANPAPRLDSFLSLLFFSPSHRHLLASTPSGYLQISPDTRALRCQEVSRGLRIASLRIAGAAASRRPREGAPRTLRAASEAQTGAGSGGSLLIASSCFCPPPPRTRNPLLVARG